MDISGRAYLRSKRCYTVIPSVHYFYAKTKMLANFQVCISVPSIGLQACIFTKKRLQHRRFSVNIANFKNIYFEKHLRTAGSDSSYILHRKLNKIIQEADWPSRLAFCFFWNIKSLYFTYSHSYSFVLSLAVIRCYSLSFFVTRCHLLSFVVTCCTTSCHSLSLVVSLVVIRCATRCH